MFYRYLCRSFASRGDAAVSGNIHLDTAREWYCQALRVYSGIQEQNYDEQDAVNSLARFLFSISRERKNSYVTVPRRQKRCCSKTAASIHRKYS